VFAAWIEFVSHSEGDAIPDRARSVECALEDVRGRTTNDRRIVDVCMRPVGKRVRLARGSRHGRFVGRPDSVASARREGSVFAKQAPAEMDRSRVAHIPRLSSPL